MAKYAKAEDAFGALEPYTELVERLMRIPGVSRRQVFLRQAGVTLATFVLISPALAWSQRPPSPAASSEKPAWTLTWSDEFNGPNNSEPDPKKWVLESGGHGWGNNELETYTPRRQNVRQEDGYLVIEAVKEKFTGPDGNPRNYTSARMNSSGRFSQKYGRFEARVKVPSGRGLWPAFWLLGDNFPTDGWPACGEIDIMENIGSEPSTVHGTLHGPGYSGGNPLTSIYTAPSLRFADAFHLYAVEWEENTVRFYADDKLYATRSPRDLAAGKRWVFDHPFYIILNLAIGGDFPGNPDESTVFPQKMLVDYVRVYSRGHGEGKKSGNSPRGS